MSKSEQWIVRLGYVQGTEYLCRVHTFDLTRFVWKDVLNFIAETIADEHLCKEATNIVGRLVKNRWSAAFRIQSEKTSIYVGKEENDQSEEG